MKFKQLIILGALASGLAYPSSLAAEPAQTSHKNQGKKATPPSVWPGKKSAFHGFDQYDFKNDGIPCKVVVPKKVADGKPWVWRARFFGHAPHFDLAMLERGYHVVYCDVSNLFGNAEAVARWDKTPPPPGGRVR